MLEDANGHRQNFIHGMASDLENFLATGTATTLRRDHRRSTLVETRYSLSEMQRLRSHYVALAFYLGGLWEAISDDPILKDDPDNSLARGFVKLGGFFPRPKRRRNAADKRG
jgi:hypothetical protein